MKKISPILLLFFALFLSSAFVAGDEAVHFLDNDYSKAVKKARLNDKAMFVMFTADYCGVCRKMDKEVFTDREVGDFFNDNFVNLKLDPTSSTAQNIRASNWGVKKLPTYIYMDENKNVLYRSSGFKTEEDIIREAQTALNKKKRRR